MVRLRHSELQDKDIFYFRASVPDDEPPKRTETVPLSYLEHLKKTNFLNKEDDSSVAVEERPTFIEDPGEGPSSRSDPSIIIPDGENDEDRSSVSSPTPSDESEDMSRIDDIPKKKKKSLEKKEENEQYGTINDMIREVEYDILMDCMKTYI